MQSTIKHVFLTKHPSLYLVAGKNKYVKIKTIWDFAVNRGVPVWIRFPNEKRCIFPCCNPKLLDLSPGPRSSSWRLSPASEREYISSFLSSSVGFYSCKLYHANPITSVKVPRENCCVFSNVKMQLSELNSCFCVLPLGHTVFSWLFETGAFLKASLLKSPFPSLLKTFSSSPVLRDFPQPFHIPENNNFWFRDYPDLF